MNHKSQSLTIPSFEIELKNILDWWSTKMIDDEQGGFIGRIDGEGKPLNSAEKGVVLNTRILWTFSAAIRNGYTQYRIFADRSFEYLVAHFIDTQKGGLFWMLHADGSPSNTKKQIYAQAFGIYAFVEYFMATGNKVALLYAQELFDLVELHAHDEEKKGYLEAFSQNWKKIEDVRLSSKDINGVKTMNTHLHLLEAYTNLYRCDKRAKVKTALFKLVKLYRKKFINPENGRLKLFFNQDWTENVSHQSFGHEIESVWLLREAASVLGDKEQSSKILKVTDIICQRILQDGIAPLGGIYNEKSMAGHVAPMQDWWPQAEATVGFYDAYQTTKEPLFLEASENCWNFIQQYLIDKKNGEWYWAVNLRGIPDTKEDKAGPWKAPYHNSRMCFEMIKRLKTNL